jgi:hypothetical protein
MRFYNGSINFILTKEMDILKDVRELSALEDLLYINKLSQLRKSELENKMVNFF